MVSPIFSLSPQSSRLHRLKKYQTLFNLLPTVQLQCPARSPPPLQKLLRDGAVSAAKNCRPSGRRLLRSSPCWAVAPKVNSARLNPWRSSTQTPDYHHHDSPLVYRRYSFANHGGLGRATRDRCTNPFLTRRTRKILSAYAFRARTVSRRAMSMRMGQGRQRRVETGLRDCAGG